MEKPPSPANTIAVELFYNNIENVSHPDTGPIRLVYFGHKSEGQKKITRQVSEALVMLLERNGLIISNGLAEMAATLEAAGYTVLSPADARITYGEAPEDSGEAPVGPYMHTGAAGVVE